MPTDVDSGGCLWLPNRNSPAVNRALSRYPAIDDLLTAIDRARVNLGWSDEVPASLADGNKLFRLFTEVGSEWICAALPHVRASSLWFIVAVYLEARQEPLCWYELSDDHANHIVWVLSLKEKRHDDTPLSPRALVLAYLMDHDGWAPPWFRPLAEA